MRILGLDEAGRGCVLGPLIVGAYLCEADSLEALKATGATDSKALSAKKREAILERLPAIGQARILSISPAQIDAGNINQLEETAFLDHIRHFKPDVVYIDAPVHPRGIPKLKARMIATLAPDGLGTAFIRTTALTAAALKDPKAAAAEVVAAVSGSVTKSITHSATRLASSKKIDPSKIIGTLTARASA